MPTDMAGLYDDEIATLGYRPVLEPTGTLNVITLNGNGGKIGDEETVKTVAAGETFTAPDGSKLTPPTGKTFNGWKNGDTDVAAGEDITITGPITLTAQWTSSNLPTLVKAPIGDDDDRLGKVEVKSVTEAASGTGYDVTLTGTDIIKHANAQGTDGYWVGLGMPVEESASYTYTVGGEPVSTIPGRRITVDGKVYETVYFDEDDTYTIVQTKTGSDPAVTATYNVEVTITKKDIPATFTEYLGKAGEFGGDTSKATLGLSFAKSDKTVTVTGTLKEIELPKFNEGVQGENKGYYLPVHIATDALVKDVVITNPNSAGGANGKTIALTNGAEDVVLYLGSEPLAAEKPENVTVNVNGHDYTLDLSGLKFGEEKVEPIAAILNPAAGVTLTVAEENGTYKVTASDKVPQHMNAENKPGNWAGIALVKPEGATGVKYKMTADGEEKTLETLEADVDGNGAEGIAFYYDVAKLDESKTVDITVQWLYGEAKKPGQEWTYKLDLNGVQIDEKVATSITKYEGKAGELGGDTTGLTGDDFNIAEPDGNNTIKVTGTLNKTELKDFNSTVTTENKGYYLPITITAGVESVTITNPNSAGGKDGKEIALKENTEDVVLYLGSTAGATPENVTVKVSEDETYTLDLTGVELVPTEEPGNTELAFTQYKGSLEELGTTTTAAELVKELTISDPVEAVTGETAYTVDITGSLNYAEIPKFNSEASGETKGYYLPLTITGAKGTKITIVNDNSEGGKAPGKPQVLDETGTLDVVLYLLSDPIADLENYSDEIVVTVGEAEAVYTLNLDLTFNPVGEEPATVTFSQYPGAENDSIGSTIIGDTTKLADGTLEFTTNAVPDVPVIEVKVSGALNYAELPGFNGTVKEENEGYYLPLTITGTAGTSVTIVNENSAGGKTPGKSFTLDTDGTLNVILYLTSDAAADVKNIGVTVGDTSYNLVVNDRETLTLIPAGETEKPVKPIGAPLDQANNAVKNIKLTATSTTGADGVINVELTNDVAIPEHKNAQEANGYWAGISLVKPEGATGVKYNMNYTEGADLKPGNLEENVDGDGAKGIAFYYDADTTKEATIAVQWVYPDKEGITTIYNLDLSNVTLNKPVTTTPEFGPIDAETNLFGKTAADLVSGVKYETNDKTVTVTGTAKYITGWTEFNGADVEEQSGNYLPINIDAKKACTVVVKGANEKTFTTTEDDTALQLVMCLNKLKEEKAFTVTIDGTEYIVDVKNVTLEDESTEKPVTPIGALLAQNNEQVKGIKLTPTLNKETGVYELTSSDPIPSHKNQDGAGDEGYWAGIALVAPEGATSVKYNMNYTEGAELKPTELEANVDGNGKDGIAFYYDADTTKEATIAVQWVYPDKEGIVATYKLDLKNVTLDKPVTTTPEFGPIAEGVKLFGKTAADLVSGVKYETNDKTVTVSGTAKYITGWTQFNSADETEQEGNYLPINIDAKKACTVVVKGANEKTFTTTEDDTALQLVMCLNKLKDAKKFTVTIDGTEYTVDFTDVTLTEKPGEEETITITIKPNLPEGVDYKIVVKDENGNEVDPDEDGTYTYTLTVGKKYSYSVSAPGYQTVEVDDYVPEANADPELPVEVKPETPAELAITFEYAKGKIGPKVNVSGLTAERVTIQIEKNPKEAPAIIRVANKVDVEKELSYVSAGSIISVWNGEITFSEEGIPTNEPHASEKVPPNTSELNK